ncbi:amino-acid racemase [Clostridia bacterium]|nr:amino-acid racemase [Clostridia bacterium]
MTKQDLSTPSILVDLDALERNIRNAQELCNRHGKQLWPMTKTHKSSAIIRMQLQAGAAGVLAGTLDECEAAADEGASRVMYAYPAASPSSLRRLTALSKRCAVTARIDGKDNARLMDEAARIAHVQMDYTIIINSGLNRFGIPSAETGAFAAWLGGCKNLRFCGISTHPGQVYAGSGADHVRACAADESAAVRTAVESLRGHGFEPEMIGSGSTPTLKPSVGDPLINQYHPGNYVFNDVIQMGLGAAKEKDCALTILATVIAHPREGIWMIDAGSKCFGLDQGAHGNTDIKGFGRVKGHPSLFVAGLSEEVGKVTSTDDSCLQVGDRLEIIPNHACVPANMTNWLIGCRADQAVQALEVNIRENSRNPML